MVSRARGVDKELVASFAKAVGCAVLDTGTLQHAEDSVSSLRLLPDRIFTDAQITDQELNGFLSHRMILFQWNVFL